MARDFRVDRELQNFINPLTKEEYKALEESILAEGCRDKLILWDNSSFPVLVDGHNRLKICEEHQIPYETIKMNFENYQDVMVWMINNQLARRNVTDEQRKYLIGKRMANEKKQGERTDLTSRQNGEKLNIQDNSEFLSELATSKKIATEYGISPRTVERNQDYALAVDTLGEKLGGEIKNKILSSEIKLTDKDTKDLSKEEPETQSKVIDLIAKGEAKKVEEAKKILSPDEEWLKEEYKKIDKEHDNHKLVASLINEVKFRKIDEEAVADYMNLAIDIFQEEFIKNCDRLIDKLNEMKMHHSNLTKIRRIK